MTGHHEPTAWDLQELYRGRPKTTIATCTRRGAARVNDLAIWVLFTTRKKRALAELPVDWEANPDNYDQDRYPWFGLLKRRQVFGGSKRVFFSSKRVVAWLILYIA